MDYTDIDIDQRLIDYSSEYRDYRNTRINGFLTVHNGELYITESTDNYRNTELNELTSRER